MTHAARALTQAIRRRPDRYELRLDFEHDLYSVANVDRDSLDLDFTKRKYLAEQDPGAGAFDFSDLITHTRAEVAQVAGFRNASGQLEYAAIGAPREGHHPAPRIVGTAASEDFSGFTDTADMLADERYSASGSGSVTLDAVDDEVDLDGTAGVAELRAAFTGVATVGSTYRVIIIGASGSCTAHIDESAFGGVTYDQMTGIVPGVNISDPFVALTPDVFLAVYVGSGGAASFARILIQGLSHADGENAGYLCEPASENELPSSDDLAGWITANVVPTANGGAVGPDGLTLSHRITDTAANSNHHIYAGCLRASSAGDVLVGGLFARAGTLPLLGVRLGGTTGDNATVDLRTGEVTGQNIDFIEVESWGDGWLRILPKHSLPGSADWFVIELLDSAGNRVFEGSGSDYVDIWQPTAEFGVTRATMPIPTTTTTAVTRTKDLGSSGLSAASLIQSRLPVTVIAQFTLVSDGQLNRLVAFDVDGGSQGWEMYTSGLTPVAAMTGSSFVQAPGNAAVLGTRHIMAARFDSNGPAQVLDGSSLRKTSPPTTLPPAASTLYFGANRVGGGEMHGILHSVKIIPRALSDAELIAESTP